MFDVTKESLLELNEAMRKTILTMDYNNSVEVAAFASTMVSLGNQINMKMIRDIVNVKEEKSKEKYLELKQMILDLSDEIHELKCVNTHERNKDIMVKAIESLNNEE